MKMIYKSWTSLTFFARKMIFFLGGYQRLEKAGHRSCKRPNITLMKSPRYFVLCDGHELLGLILIM